MRENWSIPDSTRAAMIAELASVIEDEAIIRRKPRLFLACTKAITCAVEGEPGERGHGDPGQSRPRRPRSG